MRYGCLVPRRPVSGCRRVYGDGEPGARRPEEGESKGSPPPGVHWNGEVIPSAETHWAALPLTAEDYNPAFRLGRKASSTVILLSGLSGKLPQL